MVPGIRELYRVVGLLRPASFLVVSSSYDPTFPSGRRDLGVEGGLVYQEIFLESV